MRGQSSCNGASVANGAGWPWWAQHNQEFLLLLEQRVSSSLYDFL